MNYLKIFQGFILFLIAHVIGWFQLYGQTKYPFLSTRYGTIWMCLSGVFIGVFCVFGSRFLIEGFGNKTWPTRFVSQALGMIVFAGMTIFLVGEEISPKTWISLFLALLIIVIQLF